MPQDSSDLEASWGMRGHSIAQIWAVESTMRARQTAYRPPRRKRFVRLITSRHQKPIEISSRCCVLLNDKRTGVSAALSSLAIDSHPEFLFIMRPSASESPLLLLGRSKGRREGFSYELDSLGVKVRTLRSTQVLHVPLADHSACRARIPEDGVAYGLGSAVTHCTCMLSIGAGCGIKRSHP